MPTTLFELEERIKSLEYVQLATNDFITDLVALLVKKKHLSLAELIKLIEFQRSLLQGKSDDTPSSAVSAVQQNLDAVLYNAVLECPDKKDPHRLEHLAATYQWFVQHQKSS